MPDTSEFTHSFFQASSEAWKKNKVRYGQAMYKYKTTAFAPEVTMPPVPKQSRESKQQTKKELCKRQALEEEAPLPVRKSPRLREQHLKETYAYS